MPEVNERFEYAMPHKTVQPRCDLKVWKLVPANPERGLYVVLFSEPTDGYEGVSVTNACEAIAAAVCDRYGLPPLRTLWVEHYPEGSLGRVPGLPDETFDLVTFDWGMAFERGRWFMNQAFHPVWHRVSRAWVEELVREPV